MFKTNDKVIDLAGFIGTIIKVTEHKGSRWYDVRFPSGVAVRYDHELKLYSN